MLLAAEAGTTVAAAKPIATAAIPTGATSFRIFTLTPFSVCALYLRERYRDLPVSARETTYCSIVRVDVMTVPQALDQVGAIARRTQAAGFDGMLFTETGRTAYLNAAVASQAAPGLELSTGVAVAFPRSPFVTAATAWELQEATDGNFRLGLGTQVRTHVVRRYGVDFERPGPRLRDYLLAVKACFSAFPTGKLDHHGEFYDLDFITPQWSPGQIEQPDPKVDIAAVNPWMLRMAGEVADGVHIHPLGEPGYINRHALPNIAEGAQKADRPPSDIAIIVPVMTIVGDTDEERDKQRELVRASMSFYGGTPNYAFIGDG